MKYIRIILVLWMFTTFMSCGGGEDTPKAPEPTIVVPKVEIASTVLDIEQPGGTIEVSFNSTVAWTISVDGNVNWMQVTPISGEKGIHKLSVMVDANESYEDRSAVVIIKAGTANGKFTVKQKKKVDEPKVEITSTIPELEQSGGTIEVSFTSTVAWTISIDGNADWLQVTPTSGEKGIHKLSVKVEANESHDDRIAVVAIKAGTASEKFTIKQKKKEEIPLNGSIDDLPINNWGKE